METIKIHIKKFKKWQQQPAERRWLAIDENFFFDRKVREARRLCPDSPECFIALWREADENGNIEFSEDGLRSYWKEILCIESNNFQIKKRLNALLNAGLITFKQESNKSQTEVKDPFELPEKPAPVISNIDTNKTDKQTPPKNKFSEGDMSVANFILGKIRILDPTFKVKNMEAWANEIRLMVEQDKRTHQDIQSLYDWVSRDKFWRKNVLSPAKLREKWSNLIIAKNDSNQAGPLLGRDIASSTDRQYRSGKIPR